MMTKNSTTVGRIEPFAVVAAFLLCLLLGGNVGAAGSHRQQTKPAGREILSGKDEAKQVVLKLLQRQFGNDIRDVEFTVFSYDQYGPEVLANMLPGLSMHGVSLKTGNGTKLKCSWVDKLGSRTIVLKSCEMAIYSKAAF